MCKLTQLIAAAGIFAAIASAGAARADHHDNGHQGHGGHTAAGSPAAGAANGETLSEASKAYEEAMQRMHKKMSAPYTNDVDVDFVRGMIPHHQGAIEQAEVLLKYSKNPRLRRLAGGIIASQRREIRFMENWLKEHGKGAESADMPDWLKNNPSSAAEAAERGAQD
jgi:hypothetical protein